MAGTLKQPWCFSELLAANENGKTVSLDWQFRIEVLERIAKILSGLHRRKISYGVGSLNAENLYFKSYEEWGLASLEYYPNVFEILAIDEENANRSDVDLSHLDMLCFGVLALQIITEKALDSSLLPQLTKLLERRGLIEIESKGEVDKDIAKELKKADAIRKHGTVSATREKDMGRGRGTITERGIKRELLKVKKKVRRQNSKREVSKIDEYVLAPIVKDEVREYMANQVSGFEISTKPSWMLSLEELISVCLSSVDESRPEAKIVRNWMLEVISSFNDSQAKYVESSKIFSENGLNVTDSAYRFIYESNGDMETMLANVNVKTVTSEIVIYHSTDRQGEISDDESIDSFLPPEPVLEEVADRETLREARESLREAMEVVEASEASTDTLILKESSDTPSPTPIVPPLPPNAAKVPSPTPIVPPSPGSLHMFDERGKSMIMKIEQEFREELGGEIPRSKKVAEIFDKQELLTYDQIRSLLKKAKEIFTEEKNIIVLDAPVVTVGDIHGQYFDLRHILKQVGKPKRKQKKNFGMTRRRQQTIKKKYGNEAAKPENAFDRPSLPRPTTLSSDERSSLKPKENERPSLKPKEKERPSLKAKQRPSLKPNLERLAGLTSNLSTSNMSVTSSGTTTRKEERTFLFLGDYVDRGYWSCEVLFYLLSLKVEYPNSVFMLRGNHECDTMADVYGFRDECEHKYGREIYHRCLSIFNAMPIAALINLPNQKRFMACHGGISDKVKTLEQLGKLNRFREPGVEGTLCDLLWSDPVSNHVVELNNLDIDFETIEFLPNETRGCAKKFGYRAIETFLKENDLVGLIRAHEAKEEGFQFHFQRFGTKDHLVATVFSAPNYMQEHGNKGAVMIVHQSVDARIAHQEKRFKFKYSPEELLKSSDVDKDEFADLLEPVCFNEVEQPDVPETENYNWSLLKDIQEACPYMPVTIDDFYNAALDILEAHGTAKEQIEYFKAELEERKEAEELEKKLNTIEKIKDTKEDSVPKSVRNTLASRGGKTLTRRTMEKKKSSKNLKFEQAMEKDKITKMHPDVLKEKMRNATLKLNNMEQEARGSVELRGSMEMRASMEVDLRDSIKSGKGNLSNLKNTFQSLRSFKSLELESTGSTDTDFHEFIDTIGGRSFMRHEPVQIPEAETWIKILCEWLSDVSSRKITAENFCNDIQDGVALCMAALTLRDTSSVKKNEINVNFWKPKPNGSLNGFQTRQNLLIFQDVCKELGIHFMFTMSDVLSGEMEYVLPALVELAKLAKKKKKLLSRIRLPRTQSSMSMLSNPSHEDWRTKDLEVRNTAFNSTERLMIQFLFLMIDRDDSGFIELDEILTWGREEGVYIRPSHAKRAISAVDYDNDNAIGLRDFFQFAAVLKEDYEYEMSLNYETAADSEYDDDDYFSVADFAEVMDDDDFSDFSSSSGEYEGGDDPSDGGNFMLDTPDF